jgi:phage tail-like protein
MTHPDLHPQHIEPYQSFKFRIKWDDRYIAGVSRMSALRRTTEVLEHRQGSGPGAAQLGPGPVRYEPLILEKGLSEDPVFETWADQVARAGGGGALDRSLLKDLRIEIFDEAGNLALAYTIFRCWPSEFQALPALDGSATGSLLQILKLEYDGWERDSTVVPSEQPLILE